MSRTSSSSSTILLVLILVITFPFWIAAAAVVFGVAAGLFGAAIGIIGGIFGAIVGLIALPFKLIFGWHHWGWFPHWHHNGFAFLAFIIIVALILQKRKR